MGTRKIEIKQWHNDAHWREFCEWARFVSISHAKNIGRAAPTMLVGYQSLGALERHLYLDEKRETLLASLDARVKATLLVVGAMVKAFGLSQSIRKIANSLRRWSSFCKTPTY